MLFFSPLFYLLLSISFFISFRSLLGSILSSQTDLPTLKHVDFMKAGARFLKNHHFRSKDGFGSVLGLSRPHFGSSWGSLGVSWGLPRGPRASKIFDYLWSRSIFVALDALFLSFFFLLFSMSFLISSRSLLGSILSSQTDPPTLKNVDFMMAGARFLKNHHFRSKDGFENVLGLSRPPFGSSWGVLGGLLGALLSF